MKLRESSGKAEIRKNGIKVIYIICQEIWNTYLRKEQSIFVPGRGTRHQSLRVPQNCREKPRV